MFTKYSLTHLTDFLVCTFPAPLLHLEQQQAQNVTQGVNRKFGKPDPIGWGFPEVLSSTTEFMWSGIISYEISILAKPYLTVFFIFILNGTSTSQMYFEKVGKRWNCNRSKCNFQTYFTKLLLSIETVMTGGEEGI